MPILLTAFHTLHIFWLSLTDFQNFPGPVAFFQDFPVLENAKIKFQDFPGFPGPVRTLYIGLFDRSLLLMLLIQVELALKQAIFKLRTPVSMYQFDPIWKVYEK